MKTGIDAEEAYEQVVVGWSPNGGEARFALSPTRFCQIHKLSACQGGIIRFLSRYQFEKNPWLIDQASLLAQLLLEFSAPKKNSMRYWIRKKMGLKNYVAPRVHAQVESGLSVASYCLVNGIEPQIVMLIGLICNAPSQENIERAIEQMKYLKAKR